jgi:hypothetical protein
MGDPAAGADSRTGLFDLALAVSDALAGIADAISELVVFAERVASGIIDPKFPSSLRARERAAAAEQEQRDHQSQRPG